LGRAETRPSVGFPPFARPDARVLILGSLPSAESLRRGQYYAHPRNAFWRVMGELFGASRDLAYGDRVRRLIENRIALWDVCAAAYRPGSADADLAEVVPNDFEEFFASHPHIELICLNGTKASEIYHRRVMPSLPPEFAEIRREVLPSTSPANARLSFAEKLRRWKRVLESALEARPGASASHEPRASRVAAGG